MVIRRAHPAEAPLLAALQRASIERHCTGEYSPQQIAAWTAMITKEAYGVLISEAATFVARDGEAALGVGVATPEIGLINAVYVSPGSTRQGVGRALMEVLEAELELPVAHLTATLNALEFYRSLGYRYEVPTVNRLPSGIDLPSVAMSKPLE